MSKKIQAPDVIDAKIYTVSMGKDTVYISVGLLDGAPIEIFSSYPPGWDTENKNERISSLETTNRLLSLALQYGAPVDKVVQQLNRGSLSKNDYSAKVADILGWYVDAEGCGK